MDMRLIMQFGLMVLTAGCSFREQEAVPKDSVEALISSRCELTPDAGTCKAYIPRYYFDPVTKKCTEFIWGGCGGVVPFETMEECKACENGR
jgi:hypothetical protein